MLTTRAGMPCALELLIGVDAESDLAAGADQDHRRLAVLGVGENIGATGQTCGRRVARCGRRSAAPGGSAPDRPAGAGAPMMTRHASTTSLASAGRSVMSPGMLRNATSCSTGWCVGPSSPTPIESCVKT